MRYVRDVKVESGNILIVRQGKRRRRRNTRRVASNGDVRIRQEVDNGVEEGVRRWEEGSEMDERKV